MAEADYVVTDKPSERNHKHKTESAISWFVASRLLQRVVRCKIWVRRYLEVET